MTDALTNRPVHAPPPEPVASPCIDVCRVHATTGWCEGCLRTLDEIAAWSRLDDHDKRAVWALLPLRRSSLTPPPAARPKDAP